MVIKHLDTATCYFMNSETEKKFPSFEEACRAAEDYCGNSVYTRLHISEKTRLYGPGDGTTSVMVKQDFTFA